LGQFLLGRVVASVKARVLGASSVKCLVHLLNDIAAAT
jgi:hypothetical protein